MNRMNRRDRMVTMLGVVLLATFALSTAAHAQTPAFGSATTLGLGIPVRRVVVGDLNRDGRPDLVVASPAGTIAVLLASGPGTFGSASGFALANARALALEDVNRDGILDLVVAAGDGVSVLLGDGAGGFGARLDIPTGSTTTAVALADLNGDGRPDIVVANGGASTLTVLLGNGTGAFSLVGDFPTGSSPIALALADVTGDGLVDVVVAHAADTTVSVFPGTGTGILGARRDFAALLAASDVTVVDLDLDGFPDLVVASPAGAVSVLRGAGGGAFRPATIVVTGGAVQSVIALDVNGDGRPDLALARSSPAAALVLLGDGEGGFTTSTPFINGGLEPFSIAAGDFNQDGRPDLVTANLAGNSVTVRFNTTVFAGAGAFAPAAPRLLQVSVLDAQPVTILLGNVDNVTRTFTEFFDRTGPDLVVVEDAQASVALSSEGQIGGLQLPFPNGGGVTAAVLADVNRDGILDLVLGRDAESGVVTVLLGDGAGGFGPGIDTPSFRAPISIAVGDVNRDGLPDLVIATGDIQGVLKLTGSPGGFSAEGLVLCSGPDVVRAVALADLDRDGVLDIVAARGDSTVSVCLGDANGGFGSAINRTVGQFPAALAVGDVNGDGRPDVVVANADDGTISILLGDGTGALPTRTDLATGTQPSAVALADLNRNGRLDIVVLSFGDENLRIIPDGGAAPGVVVDAGPAPLAFAIGDLNRDGRPDIAVLSADRQVRVLLNDAPAAGGVITLFANPTITEGSSVALLVRRTSATLPATVSYAAGGSAVFGVDYDLRDSATAASLPATGVLAFDVGETQKSINVRTIKDGVVGPDTTLVFTLSAPVGATLGSPSQVTTTIIEADEALFFTQPIYAASEGSAAVATVVRRGDLKGTVTVRFTAVAGSATAGSDFVAATGLLTFAPGVASLSFPVTTRADALREQDETLLLTLSEARSSQQGRTIRMEPPSVAQVTVADTNAAQFRFSAATATVAEGASINVTILRTGALNETATATYALTFISAAAADVTLGTPLTLTFGPGVTSQTIALTAVNDALLEGPETFRLTLVSATSNGRPGQIGTPGSMLVTIVDNESAFGFAEGVDLVLPETATTATFTVVRTGGTGTAATVQVRTLEGAGGGDAVPDQDYRVVPLTTLTFAPGMTSRPFTVPLVNDTVNDGPRRLVVQLSNPTGGVALGTQRTAAALLQDDDDGGVIQWSRAATTVAEAVGTTTLTVARALSVPGRHLASGVTVSFAVTGGTATNGVDYTLAAGTLTFGANEAMKTVVVPVVNDTLDEPDETVVVTLSNAQGGATLGALQVTTLTITDNDAGGVIQFAAASATAPETAASTTLRVNRGAGMAGGVTVDFAATGGTATNGIDYTLAAGTLTFEAGQTSRDITVTLRSDTDAEGPETVLVSLSNPTGGATLGPLQTTTLTIVDDEAAVGFGLPAFSVTETTTAAAITVVRTGPLTQPASVIVRSVDATNGGNVAIPGVDYLPLPPTTVTFPAGMASRTVTVSVLNDPRRDGPRTVTLALSNPGAGLALGTQRTAALTILDDDAGGVIQLGADTFTAAEATGRATLTFTRTGGLAGGASVSFVARFSSSFGPVTRSESGVVVFAQGQTMQTAVLTLPSDNLDRDERAFVQISNPTGGATLGNRQRAQVVVTDSSAGGVVRFTTAAVTVLEGSTALLTVTRTGGLAGGVTVQFFASGSSAAVGKLDFLLDSGVVVFEAGEATKSIAVPILSDALLEGPETFTVALGSPTGGATLGTPSRVTVTIVDAEAVVGFALPSLAVGEGAAMATVTVLRSGPLTSPATVQFRTVEGAGGGTAVPDVDYRPVPLTTLTFPAGMGSRTVNVPLLNDTVVDSARFINVELSNPSAGLALGTTARRMSIQLNDDEGFGRVDFAAPAFFASESAGFATVRLVRSLSSPTGTLGSGARVDIVVTGGSASNGLDYTLATGTVTFEAGETIKTFTFPVANDGAAEGPETITLQLQNASGGLGLGTLNTTTVTIFD